MSKPTLPAGARPPLSTQQTSSSSLQKIPAATAVVWERSWLSLFGALAAIVALIAWIGAALALWHLKLFLPVNYFDSFGIKGSNGNSNYNALVTFLSGLLDAVVAYGIGQGVKAILRRRLISRGGVSLYQFDALSKLSSQSIQFKARTSAVAIIIFLITAKLLGAASQAAFGSSLGTTDIFLSLPVVTLEGNIALFSDGISSILANSPMSEAHMNVEGAYTKLLEADRTSTASVSETEELLSTTDPLFSVLYHEELVRNTLAPSSRSPSFSPKESTLLAAAKQAVVTGLVEGFLANSTCSPITISSTPNVGGSIISLVNRFSCGTSSSVYVKADGVEIVDSYACLDGEQSYYFYAVNTGTGDITDAYKCSVSTSAAVVPFIYQSSTRAARVDGPFRSTNELPDSLDLASYLALTTLNFNGQRGDTDLTFYYNLASKAGLSMSDFFESVLEMYAKSALVRAQGVLLEDYLTSSASTVTLSTSTVTKFRVPALQIHLAGAQLAYLYIVINLLGFLLITTYFLLFRNSGKTDFTDPLSVALIGLGSEASPAVDGACTGEFNDKKKRGVVVDPTKVFIAFGERVPGHKHLEFVAWGQSTPAVDVVPPRHGNKYA